MASQIKTAEEIAKMRKAGKILSHVLNDLKSRAKSGVTTKELDSYAEKSIRSQGGVPGFLNYQPEGAERPFPATICSSINDVVVHGTPNNRALQDGDLLKIDIGVKVDGYHADAAITVPIGIVSKEAQELMRVTSSALLAAIQKMKPGNTLGDIGNTISATVKHEGKNKFSIVKGLTGHGIGTELHEDPVVFNEGKRGEGLELQPGMVLAIEPMVSAGSAHVVQLDDDSYATEDGSLSAHFEHTIVITENDPEILTVV